MRVVRLKKGRDRSIRHGHPWVFSGAVASVDEGVGAGEVVRVVDHGGEFIGWGYVNVRSQIPVRVLERDEAREIDDEWWRERVATAVAARDRLPGLAETDACRLIHGEADDVPGLIVDRYGRYAVLQALTAGVERVKPVIVEALLAVPGIDGVYERSDADVRELEGLAPRSGDAGGAAVPEMVSIREGGNHFFVDVHGGHKTGFYLDQRANRAAVARYARGRSVLDVFSYTGAFSVCALRAGATSSTLIDSSAPALALARRALTGNAIDEGTCTFIQDNAFAAVRSLRDARNQFGLVIVDPPRLAPTRAQLHKAERAYKDINLMAMKLLEPGGILATFSCSSAVDQRELARIVAWASQDAGRRVQIHETLHQAPDHPVRPTFPESLYLCGFICRVL